MTGESATPRFRPLDPGRLLTALRGATLLLAAGAVLMVVRLPWIGDMGVHAATVERLRHDLLHPGNPMVDSPTDSPYYSPWTVCLALFAKVTGLDTFDVLRCAAVVGLLLLAFGVRQFVRTLSRHPAAPPLAVLCLLLLWGVKPFIWSGFLGLTSLSANASYPSTFATGLGFLFLALLTHALRRPGTGLAAYTGLGALWAVLTLSHQFTGVVFTFGALGVLVAARVRPARALLLRLAAALAVGLAVLAVWPYYSFFALLGAGGLEEIHQPLYRHTLVRFGLLPLGVLALALRLRRDRRDPLVVWFLLGLVTVAAGAVLDKWSLGRTEPAVAMPAQIAAALCVLDGTARRLRAAFGVVLAAALAVGLWAQRDALTFVIRADALPAAVAEDAWKVWEPPSWTTRYTAYGDVVLTGDRRAAVTLPAYGAYTVATGYPDFFLPDEDRRDADTERYFAAGTPREERLAILRRYDVTWVLQRPSRGGLPAGDPALREAGRGPDGRVLYEVVDGVVATAGSQADGPRATP
ncbi:hypothetical protein ACFY7C_34375 [Streptomyces sp. NPDC012769]|uniref:hypothetical protein n=1 Tax=Streptomyces sp. NPDC012769 TaxID=3364848 RepID=UPI0036A8223F